MVLAAAFGTPVRAQEEAATPAFPLPSGKILYTASSMDKGMTIGDYTLSWQINSHDYSVKTSLVAKGLLSMFVSFSLQEKSTGTTAQDALIWQNYEIAQVEDKSGKKSHVETASSKNKGENPEVKFADDHSEKVLAPVYDVPTAFIALMEKMASGDIGDIGEHWAEDITLVTSKKTVRVKMLREPDESVTTPGGTFMTKVVRGQVDKMILQIWFERDKNIPIKIIFSNNKGERFLIAYVKTLS